MLEVKLYNYTVLYTRAVSGASKATMSVKEKIPKKLLVNTTLSHSVG